MKNPNLPLVSLLLGSALLSGACTKSNQVSMQAKANSTMTESAAKDAEASPNSSANPNIQQEAVTTNPNSARGTSDSTINTSASAAVVGKSNMNPRAEGEAAKTPTSVDTSTDREPLVSAALDKMDCRDAHANHYPDDTAPITSTCNPFHR